MKPVAMKGETWQSDQPDLLKFVSENQVPRRKAWLFQFRRDLRHVSMYLVWFLGIGAIAAGIALDYPRLIVWGALALLAVGCMYIWVSRMYVRSPLARGVIDRLGQDWRSKKFATARARLQPLEPPAEVDVFLPRRPAQDLLDRHGKLEVLILRDARSKACRVVGWRV